MQIPIQKFEIIVHLRDEDVTTYEVLFGKNPAIEVTTLDLAEKYIDYVNHKEKYTQSQRDKLVRSLAEDLVILEEITGKVTQSKKIYEITELGEEIPITRFQQIGRNVRDDTKHSQ